MTTDQTYTTQRYIQMDGTVSEGFKPTSRTFDGVSDSVISRSKTRVRFIYRCQWNWLVRSAHARNTQMKKEKQNITPSVM